MTTYTPYAPDGRSPFSFQTTVGGKKLFVTVPYNQYSNRFYVQIKDSSGAIVSRVPMIASPDGFDINLALPFAPGTLVYRESTNQFEAT